MADRLLRRISRNNRKFKVGGFVQREFILHLNFFERYNHTIFHRDFTLQEIEALIDEFQRTIDEDYEQFDELTNDTQRIMLTNNIRINDLYTDDLNPNGLYISINIRFSNHVNPEEFNNLIIRLITQINESGYTRFHPTVSDDENNYYLDMVYILEPVIQNGGRNMSRNKKTLKLGGKPDRIRDPIPQPQPQPQPRPEPRPRRYISGQNEIEIYFNFIRLTDNGLDANTTPLTAAQINMLQEQLQYIIDTDIDVRESEGIQPGDPLISLTDNMIVYFVKNENYNGYHLRVTVRIDENIDIDQCYDLVHYLIRQQNLSGGILLDGTPNYFYENYYELVRVLPQTGGRRISNKQNNKTNYKN
jgi:hypothetical protein